MAAKLTFNSIYDVHTFSRSIESEAQRCADNAKLLHSKVWSTNIVFVEMEKAKVNALIHLCAQVDEYMFSALPNIKLLLQKAKNKLALSEKIYYFDMTGNRGMPSTQK